jgi:hypothetical protein
VRFCRDCGVDHQALGMAVDFGALGEQVRIGDAEIRKSGLNRTWPSRRPGAAVRSRNTPWCSIRNVGKAISVLGPLR